MAKRKKQGKKKPWGRGFNALMTIPAVLMTPYWLAQGAVESFQKGAKAGRNFKNAVMKPLPAEEKTRPTPSAGRKAPARKKPSHNRPQGEFKMSTNIAGTTIQRSAPDAISRPAEVGGIKALKRPMFSRGM